MRGECFPCAEKFGAFGIILNQSVEHVSGRLGSLLPLVAIGFCIRDLLQISVGSVAVNPPGETLNRKDM
jgi:hypothetical protein